MKIIAFGYEKGSGKSTAAKLLCSHLRCEFPNLKIKEVSFAGKLKDVSFQLFSWSGLKRGVYYETHYKEKEIILPKLGLSPRDIWIGVGNKMREISPEVWLENAFNVNVDFIIIPDLRFRNEAVKVVNEGGTLVKMVRDGLKKGADAAETELDSWDVWDCILGNNGTLSELNQKVISLVS